MEQEFETVVTVGGVKVPVLATVDVDGEYHAPTWDDPEETPEADIVRVVRLDNGARVTLADLSADDIESIESRAVEMDEDDGDDNDDDF